jgi:hypothetical protein
VTLAARQASDVLVRFCSQKPRTDGMIDRAIAEAAKAFGVPAASIKKDNIRIALKAGRI